MNIYDFRKDEIDLPLHSGYAPKWLINLMVKLGKEITEIIVDEYGTYELLNRLSDPLWFQSLGCVLGYDWHSSGVTTVLTGVLKTIVNSSDLGIIIAGGKGKSSKKAPEEIKRLLKKVNLEGKEEEFIRISRLVAKIDNYLIQDGYNLYHHVIVIDEKGNWAVIQQGMNVEEKYARRYHWFSSNVKDFLSDPHSGIIGSQRHDNVLNLSSKESEENRKTTVDLISMGVKKIKEDYKKLQFGPLDKWINRNYKIKASVYRMPWNINWEAINKLYEKEPRNYIEILETEGIGPSTIRALALISEIIYGSPASWRDPVKFTFAHGGKDGVPYPVNKKVYENSISILHDAVKRAEIKEEMKKLALERIENISEKMFRMIK